MWPKCDICRKEFQKEDAGNSCTNWTNIYPRRIIHGDYEITITDERLVLVHDACYWVGNK